MCVSRDAIILILCQRSVVPSNLLTFTFLGPLVSDLHSHEIILDLPFSLIFFLSLYMLKEVLVNLSFVLSLQAVS